MATAPTMASVKFTFQSPYRAGTKLWSTRIFVTGGAWQDQAHFTTFWQAVWTEWKSAIPTITSLETVTGYNPGSEVPVYTASPAEAGTYNIAALSHTPLETALLLRWTTDQRSVKNHPIYLWNYIHSIPMDSSSTPETPRADARTAWQTRINDLVAGYSDGTLTRHRAGPRGAVAQGGSVEQYFSHRDFPS